MMPDAQSVLHKYENLCALLFLSSWGGNKEIWSTPRPCIDHCTCGYSCASFSAGFSRTLFIGLLDHQVPLFVTMSMTRKKKPNLADTGVSHQLPIVPGSDGARHRYSRSPVDIGENQHRRRAQSSDTTVKLMHGALVGAELLPRLKRVSSSNCACCQEPV